MRELRLTLCVLPVRSISRPFFVRGSSIYRHTCHPGAACGSTAISRCLVVWDSLAASRLEYLLNAPDFHPSPSARDARKWPSQHRVFWQARAAELGEPKGTLSHQRRSSYSREGVNWHTFPEVGGTHVVRFFRDLQYLKIRIFSQQTMFSKYIFYIEVLPSTVMSGNNICKKSVV